MRPGTASAAQLRRRSPARPDTARHRPAPPPPGTAPHDGRASCTCSRRTASPRSRPTCAARCARPAPAVSRSHAWPPRPLSTTRPAACDDSPAKPASHLTSPVSRRGRADRAPQEGTPHPTDGV